MRTVKKKPSEAERINSINTQTLDVKVLFQKISIPGNSRLMSYFPLKILAFVTPYPLRISNSHSGGGMDIFWNHTILKPGGRSCHTASKKKISRPFLSRLVPLFQSMAWYTAFHMKMSFICMIVNENSFSYERLCTKAHFEKEVQDNSEMA